MGPVWLLRELVRAAAIERQPHSVDPTVYTYLFPAPVCSVTASAWDLGYSIPGSARPLANDLRLLKRLGLVRHARRKLKDVSAILDIEAIRALSPPPTPIEPTLELCLAQGY
jgi:hypothetical protein